MRLVSYLDGSSWRAGVRVDGDASSGTADVVDCLESLQRADLPAPADAGVRALIEAGLLGPELDAAIGSAQQAGLVVRGAILGPPIPNPDKVICFGVNYRDHADEAGVNVPQTPMFFAKFRNSLVGPGAPVEIPETSSEVDYEGELAVVIGRTCRNVTVEDALGYVAGVMPFNDVTARDLQNQVSQWTGGKAIDTFAPCGPELVTLDEAGPIPELRIITRVNGRVVQDDTAAMMVFGVSELISFLSQTMTLVPGDVIATGTPAGVGFKRQPPLFLQHGDSVEVEVAGLGVLRSPVRRTSLIAVGV